MTVTPAGRHADDSTLVTTKYRGALARCAGGEHGMAGGKLLDVGAHDVRKVVELLRIEPNSVKARPQEWRATLAVAAEPVLRGQQRSDEPAGMRRALGDGAMRDIRVSAHGVVCGAPSCA